MEERIPRLILSELDTAAESAERIDEGIILKTLEAQPNHDVRDRLLSFVFAALLVACGEIAMRVRLARRASDKMAWWRRGGDDVAATYEELFPSVSFAHSSGSPVEIKMIHYRNIL